MSKLQDFKDTHKRFIEALNYINKNYDRLKKDPDKYETIKKNFVNKYETPLDLAWEALSIDDQRTLAPLYLYRKAQTDPQVQEILKTFGGKVIDFTPNPSNEA